MIQEALIAQAEQMRSKPLAFFVRNGHLAVIAILGCIVGGIYALKQMPIESSPEVKIPIGIVTTPYPGASPGDIEKLVTDELEDRLKNLDNLKNLTSNSTEGLSSITVEFEADADLDESIRELRDEVDSARPDLPAQAEDPIVTEVRADDRAIITFTIIGMQPMEEFKAQADELEDRLEDIAGVSKVDISGVPAREMQVLVDIQKLEGFNLSIADIARTVQSNHVDFPVGNIVTDDYYYQASLKAQFKTEEELQSLAIAGTDDSTIYLRDVADVRYAFAETSTETRLYTKEDDQFRQAVSLGVFKKTGEDLVRMADEAKQVVQAFQSTLPEGVTVLITDDESKRIRADISQLIRSAWQTVIIIAITLFLALGAKEALAAASSIPILYLITAIGLSLVGATFNFLTFFALILSLGVVIDTSIVIIEGVYENMSKFDMKPKEAALASVAAFKSPLISGTMTTLAAFLPLALMTGIMGEYVKHIPITVNITLIASLITALMILPVVTIWILQSGGPKKKKPLLYNTFYRLSEWYGARIKTILHSRTLRRRWLGSMVAAFFLSGALFVTGIVKFELFASEDFNLFFINIAAPEGTSLENTKRITQDVEDIVKTTPELLRFVTVYGGGGFSADIGGGSVGASHKASISVTLTDPEDRRVKSFNLIKDLRVKLKEITEAEVLVEELQGGPPTGADIQVRVLGDEVRAVQEFASIVEDTLRETEGAIDVTNDLELAPGEYHLIPKRDRLEFFGLSVSEVGSIMRTAVFGDTSNEIRTGGTEEDIVIRLDYRNTRCVNDPLNRLLEVRDSVTICRSNPNDMSQLLNLLVTTPRGQVPLSELVDATLTSAVTTIRHFDTSRVVNVKASVEEEYVISDVLSAMQQALAEKEMPEGITLQYGGENEDTAESMASLGAASVLALMLIFVILVYQFKSFRQVFIVLSTMPLAVMGVLYGLALIRLPLSFPGMIGMVALLGIVVNDAIVLIDKINQNRRFTDDLIEAVETGAKQRLEPVIMTTLTTALGVIPLIFSSEVFRDLAIVLAIGITIATIFTLVVIPVLYVAFEQRRLNPFDIVRWMARKTRAFCKPSNHVAIQPLSDI